MGEVWACLMTCAIGHVAEAVVFLASENSQFVTESLTIIWW